MKKLMKITVICVSILLLVSCNQNELVNEEIANELTSVTKEKLKLILYPDNSLIIGESIDFWIENLTDELVVFPPNKNTSIYLFDEQTRQWKEIKNNMIDPETIDPYIGIRPNECGLGLARPNLGNQDNPVQIRITVEGNIYRGNMEVFEESGITDEIATGSIDLELHPKN